MKYKEKANKLYHDIQFDDRVDIIIPVYHPDDKLIKLLDKLMNQTVKANKIFLLQTLDEGDIKLQAEDLPETDIEIEVIAIAKEEFDHGGTRRYGASLSEAEIMLFMTQDAVPVDEFLIEKLLVPFKDSNIGASYARQLANKDADLLEKMTRVFNYPSKSKIKSSKDVERLAIKTFFCSNVCAAYRKDIYKKLGGFVNKTIFNEDMIMGFALIGSGYKIAYVADAMVIHSHNYSYTQQFRRNFDLGVSQRQYIGLFNSVRSESEGIKMIFTLTRSLIKRGKFLRILELIVVSAIKFIGYKLGYHYYLLPEELVPLLSMNKSYWQKGNMENE